MNQEQIFNMKQGYQDWYSHGNFGLRMDIASGKYTEKSLVELFQKNIKTKVNDRCFGRRKWYESKESKVIGFHGFKEGKRIRSSNLKGYFQKGKVTNNYIKSINDLTRNRDFNVSEHGEILNYEQDRNYKERYFYNHFTKDSDDILIRKQTRMKHLETEEHFHVSVWIPDYIKSTNYNGEDYLEDYQELVRCHLREIITRYNVKQTKKLKYSDEKNIFTLDVQIHKYNELDKEGRYYSSKKLQIRETNDISDRRFIV